MKTCPKCQATVSDTAKFCGKCGFNIKKYEEENAVQGCFCTECGAKMVGELSFCTECGAKLGEDVDSGVESFASLGAFDFSVLEVEAQKQLTEQEFSAFEYEKIQNGKYIIKKLKNKSQLSVEVPECVQIIDKEAFANSSVIEVILPEGLMKIGARAFANCKDLETINIPSSLRLIEEEAFSGCIQLDLEQPKNVRCEKDAFKNTLPWVRKEEERKRKEEEERKRKEAEERKRREEEERRRKAEEERKRREEEERRRKAEEERRRREEEERRRREEEERKRQEEAERRRRAEEERKRRYTPGLKFAKVKGKEACGVSGYTGGGENVIISEIYNDLPVITIFEEAFSETDIKSVEIPQSIKSIGSNAFSLCPKMKKITIPGNVRIIRRFAFWMCLELTTVELMDGVEHICESAFLGCQSLKSISIPDSVTTIDANAFELCDSLTDIYFEGTIKQWNNISKGYNWDSETGTYRIYCTDGTIRK